MKIKIYEKYEKMKAQVCVLWSLLILLIMPYEKNVKVINMIILLK